MLLQCIFYNKENNDDDDNNNTRNLIDTRIVLHQNEDALRPQLHAICFHAQNELYDNNGNDNNSNIKTVDDDNFISNNDNYHGINNNHYHVIDDKDCENVGN